MKKNFTIIITGFFFLINISFARIILVPDDYETIQEAIDSSQSGDSVLVRPGTYYEELCILPGHEILLASTDGPLNTIIDGRNEYFGIGIGTDATLEGFTITKCHGDLGSPGGLAIAESTVEVRNCWIIGNEGFDGGGGINCWGEECNVTFINNVIENNNCYIFELEDVTWNAYGAGFYIGGGANVTIVNNTIKGNIAHGGGEFAGLGGGIFINSGCTVFIANNIIVDNAADIGPGICGWNYPDVVLEHNNVWNNHGICHFYPDPDLSEDPLFVPGPFGESYLSHVAAGQNEDSPCINFGNNTAVYLELDSLTTRTDGVIDEGIVDLGYHYQTGNFETTTRILSNQSIYEAGDNLKIELGIGNAGPDSIVHIYVVLEVDQNYWFWPSWSQSIDYEEWNLPTDEWITENILTFTWPDVDASGSARIWAVALDSETGGILGNYDYCDFEYR